MELVQGLEPQSVFRFFAEISAIPRGSGNCAAVSEYCVRFARERGLWVHRDSADNVIIRKPGRGENADAPPVILQGHLDMVTEKTPDSPVDFEKDGITLLREGDWLRARGTTLGADNGIAVAICLAILDDADLCHPPLEILLTTDEEIGMLGAAALDGSLLEGRRLLNLDSEEEGIFTVGCAGGIRVDCTLPVQREPWDGPVLELNLSGLAGGHSGCTIHEGQANAIVLLGRLLSSLSSLEPRIVAMTAGGKDNVIPRDGCVCVALDEVLLPQAEQSLRQTEELLRREYAVTDPGMTLTLTRRPCTGTAFTREATDRCVDFLLLAPWGVQAMSRELPGVVQTSLNPGILDTETAFHLGYSLRSSMESQKRMLVTALETLTRRLGGETALSGDYPAWEYRQDSPLRRQLESGYEDLFGKEARSVVIHAGLECGVLSRLLPGLDAVSYGPDIPDIHTVSERVSISSVERVWKLTLHALENL